MYMLLWASFSIAVVTDPLQYRHRHSHFFATYIRITAILFMFVSAISRPFRTSHIHRRIKKQTLIHECLPPTSNIRERFFSKPKHALIYRNRSFFYPVCFEQHLFLQVNNEQRGLEDVIQIVA